MKERLEQHEAWLKDSAEGKQFSFRNLNDVELSGANLNRAKLTDASMVWAYFEKTSFDNADMANIEAQHSIFRSCDIKGADMHNAKLKNSRFVKSDLYRSLLRKSDLRESVIEESDLTSVFMDGVEARGITIAESNLSLAYLDHADLSVSRFTDVKMSQASMTEVNLSGVEMTNVDLTHSALRGATIGGELRNVDFSHSSLAYADFSSSILIGVDLRGAHLHGANFVGSRLINCHMDEGFSYEVIGLHPAPEGDLIGYGKKSGHIVKMLIPREAKRSCATTRKFRAEYVKVLSIKTLGGEEVHSITHKPAMRYPEIEYTVGEYVFPDSFDEDRWKECSSGIHFFLTESEAMKW